MIYTTLLLLIVLVIFYFALFLPMRRAHRDLTRTRTLRALESNLNTVEDQRFELLKNGSGHETAKSQKLLEEEIRILIAIKAIDPEHLFQRRIGELLEQCTDRKGFVEWALGEMLRNATKTLRRTPPVKD